MLGLGVALPGPIPMDCVRIPMDCVRGIPAIRPQRKFDNFCGVGLAASQGRSAACVLAITPRPQFVETFGIALTDTTLSAVVAL
ncbi:MAG: hypothetical protein ACI88S_001689 [Ilumatobacter sp.]